MCLPGMYKQERPKLRAMAMTAHREHSQLCWALQGMQARIKKLVHTTVTGSRLSEYEEL